MAVAVREELDRQGAELPLVRDQGVIQHFVSCRTHKPLGDRIRSRRRGRAFQYVDAFGREHLIEA